jgi:transposase
MKVTTVGLDLAKNVFQIHAVDERGKLVVRKQLRRDQMAVFFAKLPPCLVGMEACASAHHWARKLQVFGHTVRLIAPQFVKPYVKTNKNDAADAEAICEAVSRPSMRFVAVKNVAQQALLAMHRVRQGFIKSRTAQANQIRGLLGEYGLVIPQGIGNIAKRVPLLIEDATNELPGTFRVLVDRLLEHLKALDQQVAELEAQITAWHRESEASRRLEQIPGIGPITATALVATMGEARNIVGLGVVIGLIEGWSVHESIYFAFVSGLTIGYGDFAPKLLLTRVLAILIGVCGVLLTALVAAIAVKALTAATDDGE